MKKILICSIGLMVVFTVLISQTAVAQNKGAKEMKLDGGTKEAVPFTHSKHQDRLGDCNVCHSIFPQEAGVIVAKKQKGDLKKETGDEYALHQVP